MTVELDQVIQQITSRMLLCNFDWTTALSSYVCLLRYGMEERGYMKNQVCDRYLTWSQGWHMDSQEKTAEFHTSYFL